MIITNYNKDGSKVRRPVGYSGGLCNEATRPYEKREIPGSVTKTPTAEACETAEDQQAVVQTQKVQK